MEKNTRYARSFRDLEAYKKLRELSSQIFKKFLRSGQGFHPNLVRVKCVDSKADFQMGIRMESLLSGILNSKPGIRNSEKLFLMQYCTAIKRTVHLLPFTVYCSMIQ